MPERDYNAEAKALIEEITGEPYSFKHVERFLAVVAELRKQDEAPLVVAPPLPTPENVVQGPWAHLAGAGLEDADKGNVDPYIAEKRAQVEVNRVCEGVNILEVYVRAGKNKFAPGHPGNRRESIMISCPFPWHKDSNPSAWMNLDKGEGGVFTCGPCGFEGGDKYDILAIKLHFKTSSYKTDRMPGGVPAFSYVKRKMALLFRGVDYDQLVEQFKKPPAPPVLPVKGDQ